MTSSCRGRMNGPLLETARTLPREERAQLANELIATPAVSDVDDAARLAALRRAVAVADADIAAGRVIRVPAGGLGEYIRGRGERAARIADVQIAEARRA